MTESAAELSKQCWKETGVFGKGDCQRLAALVHCWNCPVYSAAGRRLLDREIPPDALQEWTEELAKPKDVEPTGQVSVVLFRLREEWLALKTIALQEVAEVRPVHSMPLRTGRVFRGIVNINGELLVCVSVADLLGLTGEATTVAERRVYPRMLVVGEAGGRFVFPVDEVLGVRKISSADLQQAPVTVSKCPTALSRGVFSLQGRWVALFDEEKFFQALNGSLIS